MDCINISGKKWYALYTKPRHEFKAEMQLNSVSVENYLPTFTTLKQWSDRKKKVTSPLFRGYIFIYANEKERFLSVEQSTIVRTICFNGKPSAIPDWQIESLRKMLTETTDVVISDKIETGAKVKIINGPFTDVIGVVTAQQEESWLAVSVELVHRSVMVRLPKESIIKYIE
jgi:transcription antitermination factor NusG